MGHKMEDRERDKPGKWMGWEHLFHHGIYLAVRQRDGALCVCGFGKGGERGAEVSVKMIPVIQNLVFMFFPLL